MKKFLSLIICCIIISVTIFVPAQASNIAKGLTSTFSNTVNNDFEVDASGWTFSGAATYYSSTDRVWSGTKSLYIDASSAFSFSQRHTVTEGEMLQFSVHYNAVSYDDAAFVTIDVYSNTDIQLATVTKTVYPSTNSWGMLAAETEAPQRASYAVVTFGVKAKSKIYFDNAMLLQYPEEFSWKQIDREVTSANILSNSGFETASGSGPAGWEPLTSKGAWGSNTHTVYTTAKANSGSHSVKLYETAGANYPEISQTVAVEPTATYKFSMYAYFVTGKKGMARIKYLDASGNVLYTQGYPETFSEADRRPANEWTKIVKYFTIKQIPGTASIKLCILASTGHEIYVDDISLQKISDAKPCDIETDQWYYYKEWNGGSATVNVTNTALSANAGGSVKTYITKEGSSTKLVENTSAISSTITVPFTTAALNPSYGDKYIVTAEVYNANGTLAGSNSNYFIYYARPTHLNEDGEWIDENGNPLHIVMGNSASNAARLQVAKDVGVTVTTIGNVRTPNALLEKLDLCQQYGIKAIVDLFSNDNACGRYPSEVIDAVNSVKNHPAVFAWGVQDEPSTSMYPDAWLRSSYQIIRDIDPDHPVFYIEANLGYKETHFKTSDMLCMDAYYALGNGNYSTYITPYLQKIAKDSSTHHNKPTAAIIQTFDWLGYFPTENQARHMIYQTAFTGVDYGGYYHLMDSDSNKGISHPDHAAFAAAIPPIAKEEMPILYKMFRSDEGTVLASQISNLNDGNTSNDQKIWYHIWQKADKTYIAVLNRDASNSQTATFTVQEEIGGELKTYGNTTGSTLNVNVSNTSSQISMTLAAGAAAIYEYTEEDIVSRETFTANYVQKEITINGNWNETTITYTATHQLPSKDWTVEKYDDNTSDYQLNNYITNGTIVSQSTTSVSKEPFYQVKGSAVRMAKYIDVEPGYAYTLSVDATAFGKSGVWSTAHVYLYHKNADGSYTPINDYLTDNNFQNTLETVKFRGTEGSDLGTYTESSRYATGNDCYDIPVDVAFTITDSNVNAIKITLGGRTNKELGPTTGVYYFGYKLKRTGAAQIQENLRMVSATYDLGGGNTIEKTVKASEGKITLRPVKSAVDSSVSIVSQSGYFKGWQIGDNVYTSEKGEKYAFSEEEKQISLSALWYAAPDHNVISSAQSQRVTLSSGANAIRFLALVDSSYTAYAKAGFVITTLAENPTVEAGYKPFIFNNIFSRIKSGNKIYGIADKNFISNFEVGSLMNPKGILYANLVIPSQNEEIVYYATPYVEASNGTRIYGKTKAISYKELVDLDKEIYIFKVNEDSGQKNVAENVGKNLINEEI